MEQNAIKHLVISDWGDLPSLLAGWTDIDAAMFHVGQVLGLFQATYEGEDPFLTHKAEFWSDGPIGSLLLAALTGMEAMGMIEHRHEPGDYQCRWVPGYPVSGDLTAEETHAIWKQKEETRDDV